MLISNVFHDYNFEFKLNNSSLEIVDVHKHLGVYISSDNKWNKHIELIIASASKQIAYLRKLKYILPKETLNKLYCTYIRPLLEYASEVWDGCTITDSNRLEQVQLSSYCNRAANIFVFMFFIFRNGMGNSSRKKKKQKVNTLA